MDFGAILPIISSEMTKNDQMSIKTGEKSTEKAGQAFEAMFYNNILSSMTKSITNVEKDKVSKMQEDWTWALMIQTMSTEMAKENHLNIGELLETQGSK